MKRSPLPLTTFALGVLVLVFSHSSAAVVLAVLLGVVVVFFTARHRASVIYVVTGAVSGLGLVVLTPLTGSEPGTVLLRGPGLGVIDTEITLQEIGAGAIDGARLLAVALLFGVVIANLDTDRLHTMVGRIAPRSALLVALSVRLLPSLERDGVLLAESARMRGLSLAQGGWFSRTRNAATLTTPLVGSALERGMDIAEAMEARGYSGGRLADTTTAVIDRHNALLIITGIALIALGAAAAVDGLIIPIAGAGLVAILSGAWVVRS